MADQPHFTHIHCSSRFDRSPASLEYDLDNWMQHSSVITLTEVVNNNRAARIAEKGWSYYNAKDDQGRDADNCAVAWRTDIWKRRIGKVLRLSNNTFDRVYGLQNLYIWASTVVLTHDSGHRLLVSVSHPPAHIEGPNGFKTAGEGWAARKKAYLTALTNWSTHVEDISRKQQVDGRLIVADWNLNLKDKWVRDMLKQHWGAEYHLGWKHFPTEGSRDSARIIDGSLYWNMSTDGAELMPRVRSSDHRPFRETFTMGKAEPHEFYDPATGNIRPGREWWGFGDYTYDEAYEKVKHLDDGSTQVTFDFSRYPGENPDFY